ncbi:hypothetical protein pb186bvf_004740 [Paramecium bursaria]
MYILFFLIIVLWMEFTHITMLQLGNQDILIGDRQNTNFWRFLKFESCSNDYVRNFESSFQKKKKLYQIMKNWSNRQQKISFIIYITHY